MPNPKGGLHTAMIMFALLWGAKDAFGVKLCAKTPSSCSSSSYEYSSGGWKVYGCTDGSASFGGEVKCSNNGKPSGCDTSVYRGCTGSPAFDMTDYYNNKNCWCRLTSIDGVVLNNVTYDSESGGSGWVFLYSGPTIDKCTYGCTDYCAVSCSYHCASHAQNNYSDFRTALFSAVGIN
jgi:hypothetical protein